jgi:glycosyltransferase involved in cell wall biosynthesis
MVMADVDALQVRLLQLSLGLMIVKLKKSICFVMLDLNGGGIERTMLVLAEQFAARGYRADIVILRERGAFLSQVPDSVRLVPLGITGQRGAHLRGAVAFARYLRREKPGGIISAAPWINIMAILGRAIARSPARLITTDRNDPRKSHFHGGLLRQTIVPRLTRKLYPLADVNASVSTGVSRELEILMGWPEGRVVTIYNPKDVTPVGGHTLPEHPWLAKKDGYRVLVAAGRMTEQKDYPTLLRAFAKVTQTHKNLRLIIYGEGPLWNKIKDITADLGLENIVDLPGFSHQIRSEFAAADLFVLSSGWEGLPNVLIEALAEGTPVVSTDCPFGAREILEDGALGPLVPVGDHIALADAIRQVLDAPAPPRPDASLARFTEKTATDTYETLLFSAVIP